MKKTKLKTTSTMVIMLSFFLFCQVSFAATGEEAIKDLEKQADSTVKSFLKNVTSFASVLIPKLAKPTSFDSNTPSGIFRMIEEKNLKIEGINTGALAGIKGETKKLSGSAGVAQKAAMEAGKLSQTAITASSLESTAKVKSDANGKMRTTGKDFKKIATDLKGLLEKILSIKKDLDSSTPPLKPDFTKLDSAKSAFDKDLASLEKLGKDLETFADKSDESVRQWREAVEKEKNKNRPPVGGTIGGPTGGGSPPTIGGTVSAPPPSPTPVQPVQSQPGVVSPVIPGGADSKEEDPNGDLEIVIEDVLVATKDSVPASSRYSKKHFPFGVTVPGGSRVWVKTDQEKIMVDVAVSKHKLSEKGLGHTKVSVR